MTSDVPNDMTIAIRPATDTDLPAVLHLYRQPALDDGMTLSLAQAQEIFQRLQHYPNYQIYVAEWEGTVVGTFALLIMDNLLHLGRPSGVVEAVAVDPTHHRQGVGKAMMQAALEQCRHANCYKLALSTNLKRHEAHTFYESLGFTQHGLSFVVDLATDSDA